jgi:cbb3-type cytochrome oxidase subunit 3
MLLRKVAPHDTYEACALLLLPSLSLFFVLYQYFLLKQKRKQEKQMKET